MKNQEITPLFLVKLVFLALLAHWALQNFVLAKEALTIFLNILAPFFLGFVIAFVLKIPVGFFEAKLVSRLLPQGNKAVKRLIALLLTFFLFFIVLTLIFFTVVPELRAALKNLADLLPKFLAQSQDKLGELLSSWQLKEAVAWIESIEFDFNDLTQRLTSFLQTSLGGIFSSTILVIGSVFSGVVTIGLGLVFALYMLWQKEELYQQSQKVFKAYLPEEHSNFIIEALDLANIVFADFISGQLLEAFILGSLFFLGMIIFRFPYAFVVSVFIGFSSIIPVFGAFLGFFVSLFLVLLISPVQALWFILLFFVVQQIEGNLIYPRVMSARTGLPSLWVLLAVSVGAGLFGIWGILVFIPLTSVVYQLFKRDVASRLSNQTGNENVSDLEKEQAENISDSKGEDIDE